MYLSPKIKQLQQDIQAGNKHALDDFWQHCQQTGTPLIETIPENDDYRLVTFVWQAEPEQQNISILLDQFAFDLHRGAMSHLANSDVWYVSLPLFYDARILYGFAVDYPGYEHGSPAWHTYLQSWPFRSDPNNHSGEFDGLSICELPDAMPLPSTTVNKLSGQLTSATIRSQILNADYPYSVYAPLDLKPTQPQPWMLFFDGSAYASFVPAILCNLQTAGKIQPHIAIFVDHPGETRGRDLTLNHQYTKFLIDELLPNIREQYALSNDPSQAIIGGSSAGGLGAAFVAFHYPEVFGNVLSQAGVFYVAAPDDHQHPFGHPLYGKDTDYGWLIRQFSRTDKKPIRIHLDVGLYDNDYFPNMNKSNLLANRHLRDVLVAKGYAVDYKEFSGGHDFLNWRAMFPDALRWLTNK